MPIYCVTSETMGTWPRKQKGRGRATRNSTPLPMEDESPQTAVAEGRTPHQSWGRMGPWKFPLSTQKRWGARHACTISSRTSTYTPREALCPQEKAAEKHHWLPKDPRNLSRADRSIPRGLWCEHLRRLHWVDKHPDAWGWVDYRLRKPIPGPAPKSQRHQATSSASSRSRCRRCVQLVLRREEEFLWNSQGKECNKVHKHLLLKRSNKRSRDQVNAVQDDSEEEQQGSEDQAAVNLVDGEASPSRRKNAPKRTKKQPQPPPTRPFPACAAPTSSL